MSPAWLLPKQLEVVVAKPKLEDVRLGKNQKAMIYLITKRPGIRSAEIAKVVGVSLETCCCALIRLMNRGFIVRSGKPVGSSGGEGYQYRVLK